MQFLMQEGEKKKKCSALAAIPQVISANQSLMPEQEEDKENRIFFGTILKTLRVFFHFISVVLFFSSSFLFYVEGYVSSSLEKTSL